METRRLTLAAGMLLIAVAGVTLALRRPTGSPARAGRAVSPLIAAEFTALTGFALPPGAMLLHESGEDPAKGTRNPRELVFWIAPPSWLGSTSLGAAITFTPSDLQLEIRVVRAVFTGFDAAAVTRAQSGQWKGPRWICDATSLSFADGILLYVSVFDPTD